MHYLDFLLLFAAGTTAGLLNATIVGRWFVLFPSLFSIGLSPVVSNIITTCTLLAGYYVTELPFDKLFIIKENRNFIFGISILGGVAGAYVLVFFMPSAFEFTGPYLLLFSWLIFVFQNKIAVYIMKHARKRIGLEYFQWSLIPLLILSIYGTYLGAGIGILLKFFFNFYGVSQQLELGKLKYYIIILNGISGILVLYVQV